MIEAPGAIPLTCPRETPKMEAATSWSPAAVEAVWVPCPSASRAEHVPAWGRQNSPASAPNSARYVAVNAEAPTSLWVHVNAGPSTGWVPSPNRHGYVWAPPSEGHRSEASRNPGVTSVSGCSRVARCTATTPGTRRRAAARFAGSHSARPP